MKTTFGHENLEEIKMIGVLKVLLVGILLHGGLGEDFSVNLPLTQIEAVRGSCVTIPCFFTIEDKYTNDLNCSCKALWKDDAQNKEFTGHTAGLTRKNCTTTVYNIDDKHHGTFSFRLHCDNSLKWNFPNPRVNIKVRDPTLTLTPPTLRVTEGESVRVQCSAPVLCLSLPPTLTWSPVLGDVQETFRKQNNNYVKVFILNFTASHIHHEESITCSAEYTREDVTPGLRLRAQIKAQVRYGPRNFRLTVDPPSAVTEHSSVTLMCSSEANPPVQHYSWYNRDGGTVTLIGNSSVLNINASKETTAVFCEAHHELGTKNSSVIQLNVLFEPEILSSSNCTGDLSQMSCWCEAKGNPSPLIQWYFPGVSANISITNEALSDSSVRSVITVKEPQWREPVTLICHSSNSQGSDHQTFTVSVHKAPAEQQGSGGVLFPVLIASIVLLTVLVLVLLSVIRTLVVCLKKPQSSPEVTEQRTGNADLAGSATNSSQDDVLYSTVTWKTKSNKKKEQDPAGDAQPSCRSNLEEQLSIVGDGKDNIIGKETECEYAQVKFKPRATTSQ